MGKHFNDLPPAMIFLPGAGKLALCQICRSMKVCFVMNNKMYG